MNRLKQCVAPLPAKLLNGRSVVLLSAVLAVTALVVTLGGCFQKPRSLATDKLCEPASFSVGPAMPGTPATVQPRLQSANISLLIWNCHKGETDGWLADLARLSRNYQLILLQEAYLENDLLAFLKESGWSWNIATTFRYLTIPTGVLTASTVTADLSCQFTAMEPWIRLPKGILISRYMLTGTEKNLVVANVHLINFTVNTKEYSTQLSTLKTILLHHDGPLIVAGDFNTWSSERSQLVKKFAVDLGLHPVEFSNSVRSEVFGRNVDHVYYRGVVVSAARGFEVSTSDHNPMTVEFSIAEAPEEAERHSGLPLTQRAHEILPGGR